MLVLPNRDRFVEAMGYRLRPGLYVIGILVLLRPCVRIEEIYERVYIT